MSNSYGPISPSSNFKLGDYKGTWAAATNTPTLADGTGTSGDYYLNISVGTNVVNFGSGNISFNYHDVVGYDGLAWQNLGEIGTIQEISSDGSVTITNPNGPDVQLVVTKANIDLGNVPNVDATNASNINSGTLNIARLPTITIAKGGTNSTTALTNNKVMISKAGAIVEGATQPTSAFWVDTVNGNDTWTGTEQQPFLTLNAAIQTALTIKTIFIKPGSIINEAIVTPASINVTLIAPSLDIIWNGNLVIATGTTIEMRGIFGNSTNIAFVQNYGSFLYQDCYFTSTFNNAYGGSTAQVIFCNEAHYLTDLGNNVVDCIYSNTSVGTPTYSCYGIEIISVTAHTELQFNSTSIYNVHGLPYNAFSGVILQRAYTPPAYTHIEGTEINYRIYDIDGALGQIIIFNNNGKSYWNLTNCQGIIETPGDSQISIGFHNTGSHALAGSIMHIDTTFEYNGATEANVTLGFAGPGTLLDIKGTFFTTTNTFPQPGTPSTGTLVYNLINGFGNTTTPQGVTYVASNGNDITGQVNSPLFSFATIQAAVEVVSEGEVIQIYPNFTGYDGDVTINSGFGSVTIEGIGGEIISNGNWYIGDATGSISTNIFNNFFINDLTLNCLHNNFDSNLYQNMGINNLTVSNQVSATTGFSDAQTFKECNFVGDANLFQTGSAQQTNPVTFIFDNCTFEDTATLNIYSSQVTVIFKNYAVLPTITNPGNGTINYVGIGAGLTSDDDSIIIDIPTSPGLSTTNITANRNLPLQINAQIDTDYTLQPSDCNKLVTISATDVVAIVVSDALAIGFVCQIYGLESNSDAMLIIDSDLVQYGIVEPGQTVTLKKLADGYIVTYDIPQLPANQMVITDENGSLTTTPAPASWTPVLSGWTNVGSPTVTGTYTKVGTNLVFISIKIVPATSVASTVLTSTITGLPFAVGAISCALGVVDTTTGSGLLNATAIAGTTTINPPTISVTSDTIIISGTYSLT